MKSIIPVLGAILVLLVGSVATGRVESKETKDGRDAKGVLSDAAVFAGPDGKTLEPPEKAGRVTFSAQVDTATFWKTHGEIETTVKLAKTLMVYRGIPRVGGLKVEPKEEEKKTLFSVDGEWFRTKPQEIPAELAAALRTAVFRGAREPKAGKLCGGFHADVMLRWGGGILTETGVLICFSCQEVRMFGATGTLYADLTNDQTKELRELLAPYLKSGDGIRDLPALPGGRF